ncbi:hypothetical protein [Terribacillus sp. FSL K6-0262]|uniref:hypothetical protein n=1 Tax=Terribacillus sp. FSL K6-0262 TaxID=2921447 RepID=UPI0030EDB801
MGWVITGLIILGLLICLVSQRIFYMLVYFALLSAGLFIYRVANGQSFWEAFIDFGLVDIVILIVALVMIAEKLKSGKG